MSDAGLARFIDRWTIEFIRTYPHPIERVWRAVTDEAEVAAWFLPPDFGTTRIEARTGGAYALGEPRIDFKGRITAFEPPRYVRYGGPHPGAESYWEFRLAEADGGTRMVFVQRITPGAWTNPHDWPADPPEHPAGEGNPWRPGTLSGWHGAFDHLGDLMDGGGLRPLDEEALQARYRRHMLATQP